MQQTNLYKSLSASILVTLILSACNSGTNNPSSGNTAGTLSSSHASNLALNANQTPTLASNKTNVDLTYTNNSKFAFHCAAYKDTSTKISTGSNSFTQDIGPSVVDYLVFSTNFSTDSYGTLSCSNQIDPSNPWGFKISSPEPQVNTITLDSNTLAGNITKVSCTDPKTGTVISKNLNSAQPSINCRAGTYVYSDGRANPTDGVAIYFSSTITPVTPVPEIIAKPPVIANDKTTIALGVANNFGDGEVFTCNASSTQSAPNGGSSTQSWKLTSSGVYPGVSYYQDFNPAVYGALICTNNSDSLNKWGLQVSTNKVQTVTLTLNKNTVANYSTNVSCLSDGGSKISQTLTPENNSITCRAQNWLYTTSTNPIGDIRADKASIVLSPLKNTQPIPAVVPTSTPTPTITPVVVPTEFSMPNLIPADVVITTLSDIYSNALVGFDNNTGDNLKCTTQAKSSNVNGVWVNTPGLNLSITEKPLYIPYSISNQGYMSCSNGNSANKWGFTIDTNGGRSNIISLNSDNKVNYSLSVSCISKATNLNVTKALTPGVELDCRAAKYMYSDGIERSDPIAIMVNKS